MKEIGKLYISIDEKTKEEINGTIYNKPRKLENEIYIRFIGTRVSENVFELDIYKRKNGNHIILNLDETFFGRMNGKNILFYIEQRIELIDNQL